MLGLTGCASTPARQPSAQNSPDAQPIASATNPDAIAALRKQGQAGLDELLSRDPALITGNSIHYVLDADGTVLDALPGLYGAAAFLAELKQSEGLSGRDVLALRRWHGSQGERICQVWLFSAMQIGMYGPAIGDQKFMTQAFAEAFPKRPALPPDAEMRKFIDQRPVAKSMVENPISQRIGAAPQRAAPPQAVSPSPSLASAAELSHKPLADRMTNELWEQMANIAFYDGRLDESSQRLMMAKLPRESVRPDDRAFLKSQEETPYSRTLERFEHAIALDTVRNQYLFHTQIHQWLEEDTTDHLRRDVEALNKRVYSELFLTPDHDAWLGLVPDDTYTALEKDGCACDKGAQRMR
jgi:hypothetical protein